MDTDRPTSHVFDEVEVEEDARENLVRRLTARVEAVAREDYEVRLLSAEVKSRQKKLDNAKATLAVDMAAAGMKNFKTLSGLQPSITEKRTFYGPGQDDPRVIEYANSVGWSKAVQQIVSHQSLQHLCEEVMKNGATLPEWIQVSTTPSIRLGGKTQFARRQYDNGTGQTDDL